MTICKWADDETFNTKSTMLKFSSFHKLFHCHKLRARYFCTDISSVVEEKCKLFKKSWYLEIAAAKFYINHIIGE